MSWDTKMYEISYLLQNSGEDTNTYALDGVRKRIEKAGGMITEEIPPQKRKLSFVVEKQNEAALGYLRFYAKPEEVKGIQEELKNSKEIIRYLLLEAQRQEHPQKITVRRTSKEIAEQKAADVESIDKKLNEILGS